VMSRIAEDCAGYVGNTKPCKPSYRSPLGPGYSRGPLLSFDVRRERPGVQGLPDDDVGSLHAKPPQNGARRGRAKGLPCKGVPTPAQQKAPVRPRGVTPLAGVLVGEAPRPTAGRPRRAATSLRGRK